MKWIASQQVGGESDHCPSSERNYGECIWMHLDSSRSAYCVCDYLALWAWKSWHTNRLRKTNTETFMVCKMPATFANLNPIQVVQPSRLSRLPREMASNSDLGSSTQRMDASEWSKKCKQYSKIFQAEAVKFSSTSQVMSVFPLNHHIMISPWEFTQTPPWYRFFRLFLGHWRFGSERLSRKSGGVPLLQKLFLQTRVARGISIPNWPAKTSLNNQWDHVGLPHAQPQEILPRDLRKLAGWYHYHNQR